MPTWKKLSFALLLASLGAQATPSLACTPPQDGRFRLPAPEEQAIAVLAESESVYIGFLQSVKPAPSGARYANRLARFKLKTALRGRRQVSLLFEESTCGSPLWAALSNEPGQPLVVLAKAGRLLRAYPEASVEGPAVLQALAAAGGGAAESPPPTGLSSRPR